MIHFTLMLLALAGFAALLLARHPQDWLGRKLAPRALRMLRAVGFALLALGFAGAGWGLGWAYGAVCWFGWLTAAAGVIVMLHTHRDALTRRIRP